MAEKVNKKRPILPEEHVDHCSGCGFCYYDCSQEAISQDKDDKPTFDLEKCTGCGECSNSCPGAVKLIIMAEC